MAKESVEGEVKTRLVPPLSFAEAAAFNTACLLDVAENLCAAAGQVPIAPVAAYSPSGAERFFAGLLPPEVTLLPPRESSLGRSLHHAARDLVAAGYGAVCLVNADSPTLPTEIIVAAARRLAEPGDRVVLGPAADGGYYLIGFKGFHPRLFEEIDWSTERVFRQTIARAEELGLEPVTLPQWYDVDDGETLALLGGELFGPGGRWRGGFAAPATARLLRDLAVSNDGLRQLLGLAV
ncbi:MAG TPA: TIGR04282 family arsenosugar biosynthesis glycosyltransferase [Stellaceae bacterium]|nr:TIGR04282 family arsenosugar biosynthesis glycosyltransferase [Stellaceae bacterium]